MHVYLSRGGAEAHLGDTLASRSQVVDPARDWKGHLPVLTSRYHSWHTSRVSTPGERLKALIDASPTHNQRSLAAAVGVSEQSIANYINDETQPRQKRVRQALADELGNDVYDTRDPVEVDEHARLKDLRFLDADVVQLADRLAALLHLERGRPAKTDQSNVHPGHETWRRMPLRSQRRDENQA